VSRLLRTGRMVSLVGPGGSGKTRLAAEVAAALSRRPRVVVGWVDLAPLADPHLVTHHVASTLGVREQRGREITATLLESLGSSPLVLVLDNCEHLLEPCAVLADALLRHTPRLRILTTSRQALGIPGERVLPVPPLPVPASGEEGPERAPAVQLFVHRARDVAPGFVLTEQNAPAVARICRRLDGLPLAIELAAARVNLLPPEQLAARLDQAFDLLSSRSSTGLPRHRTLRALIDWSYDLLSPGERTLLEVVSLFSGGFTLEAVEEVASSEELPTHQVLDLLAGLVDRSLVTMREWRDRARYSLLETVREHALAHLKLTRQGARLDALHRSHALHFLGLAEEAAGRLHGVEQVAWLERLELEHENMRAALNWAVTVGEPDLTLRLCLGLSDFWRLRGHLTEGRQWMEAALARSAGCSGLKVRVLAAVAVLGRMQGDYGLLDRLLEGEEMARRAGDPAALGALLTQVGMALRDRQRLDEARVRLDEAMELGRRGGDGRGLALALGTRASIALAAGDLAGARALRLEAVELSRAAGDREGEARALVGLGEVARLEGDLPAARFYNEQTLAIVEVLGDRWEMASVRHNLGWIALETGRLDDALGHFTDGVGLFRRVGNPFGLPLCLFGYGGLLAALGDPREGAVAMGNARSHMKVMGEGVAATADARSCRRVEAQLTAALEAAVLEEGLREGWGTELAAGIERAERRVAELLGRPGGPLPGGRGGEPGARAGAPSGSAMAAGSAAGWDLRVRALGPLEIRVADEPLEGDAFGSSKPRELLLLLLLHSEGCTRDQVGVAFWPEASAAQVKNNFHVTLHRLRRALGDPAWVVAEGDRYRMAPGLRVEFDVTLFEGGLETILSAAGTGGAQPGALAEVLELYRGDFLEGAVAGDWHLPVRDRLQRLCIGGLMRLGWAMQEAGRVREAADAYRRVLARDRLHEEAYRGLMRCHALEGERTAALRVYDTLVLLLRDELGRPPDPATTTLRDEILRGSLPASPSAL
jgi:predicted ATPase/DNA-binding SARP family transcriptional activator